MTGQCSYVRTEDNFQKVTGLRAGMSTKTKLMVIFSMK